MIKENNQSFANSGWKKDFMRWIYHSQARLQTCPSERQTLQAYVQDVFGWWNNFITARTDLKSSLLSSVREGYSGGNRLRWLPKLQVISIGRHFCMQSRVKKMCMTNLLVIYNPVLSLGWNYYTDSYQACVVLWTNWCISAIYPSNQQEADYRTVSTPTMHSDKDFTPPCVWDM